MGQFAGSPVAVTVGCVHWLNASVAKTNSDAKASSFFMTSLPLLRSLDASCLQHALGYCLALRVGDPWVANMDPAGSIGYDYLPGQRSWRLGWWFLLRAGQADRPAKGSH
jgi:hypothetical protein